MQRWITITLSVEALESPKIIRRCPRCDTERRFVCSGKFRINAQKRLLDIWLIYKCERCDATWNCTIFERRKPEQLNPIEHQGFLSNEEALARRCSFDRRILQAAGAVVDEEVPYKTTRTTSGSGPEVKVIIFMESWLEVRLERLLSRELGLSRSQLEALSQQGALSASPQSLRRSATHGQEIVFSKEASSLIRERLSL